jgi:hypothetical protein
MVFVSPTATSGAAVSHTFILTLKRPDGQRTREHDVITCATFEEARRAGRRVLADHGQWSTHAVDTMPQTGGDVVLPDGYTLTVRAAQGA